MQFLRSVLLNGTLKCYFNSKKGLNFAYLKGIYNFYLSFNFDVFFCVCWKSFFNVLQLNIGFYVNMNINFPNRLIALNTSWIWIIRWASNLTSQRGSGIVDYSTVYSKIHSAAANCDNTYIFTIHGIEMRDTNK